MTSRRADLEAEVAGSTRPHRPPLASQMNLLVPAYGNESTRPTWR